LVSSFTSASVDRLFIVLSAAGLGVDDISTNFESGVTGASLTAIVVSPFKEFFTDLVLQTDVNLLAGHGQRVSSGMAGWTTW